jgi:drug/metabolite transporter (DMT)-like permease
LNPAAVALVVSSTFMHAGWNLLVRGRKRQAAFINRMLAVVVLAGLAPAAVSEALTRSLPPAAWACAGVSGICCGVYYFGLARAYASSDFTVVYPVARALPVLLVAFGDVLLGRPPTPIGWVGMLLVAGGCLLAPLRSFGDFALARYVNRASAWILLTALGTVGYTLFDKAAAEVVQKGPATAARYGYVFFVVSYLGYALLLRLFEKPVTAARPVGWAVPALAAGLNFGAYWLVLWAYQLARQAGYLVAFRQFSIVIGVVLAFAIFKEQGRAVRLTGTFLLLAGLVLIALCG